MLGIHKRSNAALYGYNFCNNLGFPLFMFDCCLSYDGFIFCFDNGLALNKGVSLFKQKETVR